MYEHLREASLDAWWRWTCPYPSAASASRAQAEMLRILAHTPHRLPAGKPRYLMGWARRGLVQGVADGVVCSTRDADAQCAQRPLVHPFR